MISKEDLKNEIENVRDEHVPILYRIIKSFEHAEQVDTFAKNNSNNETKNWQNFVEETFGCLSMSKIGRGEKLEYEQRDNIQ